MATKSNKDHSETLVKMEIEGVFYDIPSHWICPITCDMFSAPVMTKTGLRYERSAIIDWLRSSDGTCPLTRKSMTASDLIPDRQLQYLIESWKVANGVSLGCRSRLGNGAREGFRDEQDYSWDIPFAELNAANPTNAVSMRRAEKQKRRKVARKILGYFLRHHSAV